jgi:MSHA biogenesis protein MshL
MKFIVPLGVLLLFLASCASAPPAPVIQDRQTVPLRPAKVMKKPPPEMLKPLGTIKPAAATEKKLPYETRIFSLSARSAPLQDVLMGLAKEAGLNLVFEKGVDPLLPVSVEINNLSLHKTLDLIFAAYDYSYMIDGNVLMIKHLETRFLKVDIPPFFTTGESTGEGTSVGGMSSGETTSGSGSQGTLGGFSVTTEVKEDRLDTWKNIEEALGSGQTGGGGAKGGLLSDEGTARVDPLTGTVVITDRRVNLDRAEEFLRRMEKAARRQVIIEARVIEVHLNESHQFGIDWSYLSGDAALSQALTPGFNIFQLNIPWAGNDIVGRGDLLLQALATQGDINVLSAPRIHVINNQSAILNVGQSIPYLDYNVSCQTPQGQTNPVCVTVPTVKKASLGVSLGVTPQITEDGMITLHIVPVINDLAGYKSLPSTVGDVDVPIIQSRGTDSIVQAQDGQTVVIGGLIQEKYNENVTGVPFAKDIPLIGFLFAQQSLETSKVELVITLTPTIIHP